MSDTLERRVIGAMAASLALAGLLGRVAAEVPRSNEAFSSPRAKGYGTPASDTLPNSIARGSGEAGSPPPPLPALAAEPLPSPPDSNAVSSGILLRVSRGIERAQSCPTRDDLLERLRSQHTATMEAAEKASPPLILDVQFSESSDALVATIVLSGRRQGERTLRDPGPDCTALGDAVVVTLAMSLDEFLAATPPPPESLPAPLLLPPAPSAPRRITQEPGRPPPAHRRIPEGKLAKRSHRAWVGPGMAVTRGMPERWSWMTTVRLGLDFEGSSIAVGGFLTPSVQTHEVPPGRVQLKLAGATVEGCARLFGTPALRGEVCPLVVAGGLTGRGEGYEGDTSDTQLWVAPGARLQLRGPLVGPLSFAVGGPVVVTVSSNEFHIENVSRSAFSMGRINGWFGADLLLTI